MFIQSFPEIQVKCCHYCCFMLTEQLRLLDVNYMISPCKYNLRSLLIVSRQDRYMRENVTGKVI